MNKKLLFTTFKNTTCAVIYIFGVVLLMQNGDKMFGKATNNIIGAMSILMLFCLSAAVVGWLTFGKSITLFIQKKINDGLKAAVYGIGWLGIYTILAFAILVLA